jgi:hypothetical protein
MFQYGKVEVVADNKSSKEWPLRDVDLFIILWKVVNEGLAEKDTFV